MSAPWWAWCFMAALHLAGLSAASRRSSRWIAGIGLAWVVLAVASRDWWVLLFAVATSLLWADVRSPAGGTMPPPKNHRCEPPTREVARRVDSGLRGGGGIVLREELIDGDANLWRCTVCRELWRVGAACYHCDRYGLGNHQGGCNPGTVWRPARTWQRLRAALAGRP